MEAEKSQIRHLQAGEPGLPVKVLIQKPENHRADGQPGSGGRGAGRTQCKSSLSSRPEKRGAMVWLWPRAAQSSDRRSWTPFLGLSVRLSPQGPGEARDPGALCLFSQGTPDRHTQTKALPAAQTPRDPVPLRLKGTLPSPELGHPPVCAATQLLAGLGEP